MKRSTILRTGCATLAILAVAACGGSNGGSSPGPISQPDSESYAAMASAIAQAQEIAAGAPSTEVLEMPDAGTGTYVGGMSVSHTDGTRMNALMVLRADFGQGVVDGHLTNFSDARRGDVSGELDMSGARITGNQLTGTFAGELDNGKRMSPATAEMWGSFYTEDGEYISGQILLTQGTRALDGDFITLRPEPVRLD